MSAKIDREFAVHDLRHAHVSLDILLAEMRHNADRIAEELDRVRAAEATLNHTGVIQR